MNFEAEQCHGLLLGDLMRIARMIQDQAIGLTLVCVGDGD